MKAVELKELDIMYHIHFLAFSNFRAKATKKAGKNKNQFTQRLKNSLITKVS